MGQTCKSLERIAGEYFHANYVIESVADYNEIGYHFSYSYRLTGFNEYIQNLLFLSVQEHDRNIKKVTWYVANNCKQKLKRFRFWKVNLTGAEIQNLCDKWKYIESVAIEECIVNRNFYEQFPKLCKSLRRLYVGDFECRRNVLKRHGNDWLLSKYPVLEHFHWTQTRNASIINEFRVFFELNPQVRSFTTNVQTLWVNRHIFQESSIKLDDLTIEVKRNEEDPNILSCVYELLLKLKEHGVYKRLHLNMKRYSQRTLNEMVPLNSLKSLRLNENDEDGDKSINLPQWMKLVELEISDDFHLFDMDALIHQLKGLKRATFRCLFWSDLLKLSRNLVHLTKCKINRIGGIDDDDILNLSALNKERKNLEAAKRLTIYIPEKIYLETKWAMNGATFSLIEIRRDSSHEWGYHIVPWI